MNYLQGKELILQLGIGQMITLPSLSNDHSILIERPKNKNNDLDREYPVETNFVIILDKNGIRTKPTHQFIFKAIYDLSCEYDEDKNLLLKYFDEIFYGEDPVKLITIFNNSAIYNEKQKIEEIGKIYQLLLLEQDINYPKSKFKRPSLYLQGWLRELLVTGKTQDSIKSQMTNKERPDAKYTHKDDMPFEDIIYNKPEELWYLV